MRLSGPIALLCVLASSGCGGATTTTVRPQAEAPLPRVLVVVSAADPERVVPDDEVRVQAATEPTSAAERVETIFEEARAHAVRFEHAEALAKIGEAQVLLESDATSPADWAALHRALAYRGLFESNLGRQDRARAALAAAALLDSDAALSDVEFPPDIVALYIEVATELRAESPAALAVTTTPSQATVLIDGDVAGTTPLTLHAAPGQHYVSFSAFGRAHRNLTVEIDADGNAPLDVDLPLAGDAELSRQLLRVDDPALAALGDEMRGFLADRYATDILIRTQETGAALALRLSDGAVSVGSLTPGEPGAVATLIADLPPMPEAPSPPPAEEESVLSSPWLWVIVGALVLGGAAAAIGVVATEEPDPILRATSAD